MRHRNAALHTEKRARSERLELRVDRQTKTLVERAAKLEHRNVTDFCLSSMTEAARQVIARHDTLILSERARDVFFDTLVNPPQINARLRRAFELAQKQIKS